VEYTEPEDARHLPGLKLVLTRGVPGPWGESAKKILEFKGIEFIPVAQYASQPNEALVTWTGIRNAPILILEEEPPRTNFQDIVAFAERMRPEPTLIPDEPDERLLCLGISAEICGEGGFGWKRRHLMRGAHAARSRDAPPVGNPGLDRTTMANAYGGSDAEAVDSPRYLAAMLDALAARLHLQAARGSPYFIGDSVTACDIHWACFSALLEPLPHEVNPMPDWLRVSYSYLGPGLESHKHPILLAHRDHMFAEHLGLPLEF
jgi:glutathione S-transferase